MKTKKLRILSLILCLCMLTTLFAGCSNKGDNEEKNAEGTTTSDSDSDDENVVGTATAVSYNAEGKFTTTLTMTGAKFSEGLTAEDVSVGYGDTEIDLEQVSNLDELDDASAYEAKIIEATIESVVRKDDETLEITYTDTQVKEKAPIYYGISVAENKTGLDKEVSANIEVQYPEDILQPNVDFVLASDKDIRLTLELKEGGYAENVTEEDIKIGGSFENLTIGSLSSAGKNLTMQLTGDLSIHESSGVYLDGTVTVNKNAIVDAAVGAQVSIPVRTELVRFVSEEISADGGTVTVPLTLIGVTDIDSLDKDSIKFEDNVTVTDLKKDDETRVTLTLDVTGASDNNSAAAILDGQTVTIGDEYSFTAAFSPAGFYPVFDYAEEDGDNLTTTLELYANSGTFAESLDASQVSLDEDFAEGKVISLERLSDSTAELIISVPSGGQTAEDLDMDGEVTLAAGTLINAWGDASSDESTYSRNYSQESMGRDLSDTDISAIKEIVGGFGNTTFGTISSIASGASTGYTVVKTILEMTGVIKSEHQQVMDELASISGQISEVQDTLNQHTLLLKELAEFQTMQSLREFNTKLFELETYCNRVKNYYANAGSDSFQSSLAVQKPAELTAEEEKDSEKVAVYNEAYEEYRQCLIKAMEEADARGDGKFKGFKNNIEQLDEKFIEVASLLKVNQNNPIDIFDQSCTYIYNFDTSAYAIREAYRSDLTLTLSNAVDYIILYYSPENPTSKEASTRYVDASKQIDSRPVNRRTDDKVYFYVKGVTIYTGEKAETYEEYKGLYEWGKKKPSNSSKNAIELVGAGGKFSVDNDKIYIHDSSSCAGAAMMKAYDPSTYMNFSNNEYTMFCNRMKNRGVDTLKKEFESAGINIPSGTVGMAVSTWWDRGCFYAYYIAWDKNSVNDEFKKLALLNVQVYAEVKILLYD